MLILFPGIPSPQKYNPVSDTHTLNHNIYDMYTFTGQSSENPIDYY